MAQVIVPNDIVEQILENQEVKDLISYKTVCKSWHSLISKSRFVKSHLQKNYNKDRNYNPEIGHRRISNTAWMYYDVSGRYEVEYDTHIVGSSNGLVCISRDKNKEFFVFNPSTREVKKVTNPDICELKFALYGMYAGEPDWEILCMGFGYDSLIDDYKVVLGFYTFGRRTRFLVLNLKSNVWKIIEEEIDYICTIRENRVGTLCNGMLYWFLIDEHTKEVKLISFDLSKEEFREHSQPDTLGYKFTKHMRLGVMNDCLCIFQSLRPKSTKWVLKDDYWMILDYDDDYSSSDVETDLSYYWAKCSIDDPNIWLSTTWEHTGVRNNFDVWFLTNSEDIGAPILVQSLVSPHGSKGTKRKRQDSNRSRKVARF